jgi:hypothetical protein
MSMENIGHIISIWIGIAGAFVSVGVAYGMLKGDIKQNADSIKNHHKSIDKLFDTVNNSASIISELKGRLESIDTTLNRLATKIDTFIMQERR